MLVAGEFWIVSLVMSADGRRRVDELLLASRRRDDHLLLERRPARRDPVRAAAAVAALGGRCQQQNGGARQRRQHRGSAANEVRSVMAVAPCERRRTAQAAGDGMMIASAPVAQLDRAPDFESVGRRFESCRARHLRSPASRPATVGKRLERAEAHWHRFEGGPGAPTAFSIQFKMPNAKRRRRGLRRLHFAS